MRTFKIVKSKSGGIGKVYKGSSPMSAASKAFTQLCKAKNIKSCNITIRETSLGSANKEFKYKCLRKKYDKPIEYHGIVKKYYNDVKADKSSIKTKKTKKTKRKMNGGCGCGIKMNGGCGYDIKMKGGCGYSGSNKMLGGEDDNDIEEENPDIDGLTDELEQLNIESEPDVDGLTDELEQLNIEPEPEPNVDGMDLDEYDEKEDGIEQTDLDEYDEKEDELSDMEIDGGKKRKYRKKATKKKATKKKATKK